MVEALVVQRARNELIAIAYEIEEKTHREIHKLLTAVNLLLKRHKTTHLRHVVSSAPPSRGQ